MAERLIEDIYEAQLRGITVRACGFPDERLSVNGTQYAPQINYDPSHKDDLPCTEVLWGLKPTREDSIQSRIPLGGCSAQRAVGLCPRQNKLTPEDEKAINAFIRLRNRWY